MSTTIRELSLASIIAAAVIATSVSPSNAASPCGRHEEITKVLTSKYQETRRILGVINTRNVMEIFLSPQGTWTVLLTDTNGMSCITASGEAWQEVPIAVAGLNS
jgi:hypothetical protein